MSPRDLAQQARRNLDVIALVTSLLTAVGYTVKSGPVRLTQLEQDVAEIRGYAEAAAIDLCLTRPDSTLARMRLDCKRLLHR